MATTLEEQARTLGDPTRHRIFRYIADASRRARRDGVEVVLRACPFVATALVDPDSVSSLPLGIAQGVADATGGRVIVDELPRDPRRASWRLRLHEPRRSMREHLAAQVRLD
jgi:hypothetical protein